MDGAGGGGEKPLPLGSPAWGSSAWGSPAWCSQAWGSQGLGFRATGTGCRHVLCAPLWAGGEGSRLPALSRVQYLGLGHTGKRCHLQLLRRQSWHGDGGCRGPPARSAFPPSPLSPASPRVCPSPVSPLWPGPRDITWLSPRWLRGQVRSLRPIPRHGSGQGQSVLDSKSELLWKQTLHFQKRIIKGSITLKKR